MAQPEKERIRSSPMDKPLKVSAWGGVESFVSKPNPSLLGHHLKLSMEQEGKGTPLHVSHQPKDHKHREGEGATEGACSPTGGWNLRLKVKANGEEKQQHEQHFYVTLLELKEDNLSIISEHIWP